jgi:transcriptional regulator with PAS, ATPase and Fis domain
MITSNPLLIKSRQTAVEVSRLFLRYNLDSFQVINDEDEPVGVITRNHLLCLIAQELPLQTSVQDLLSMDTKNMQAVYNTHELPQQGNQPSTSNDNILTFKSPPAKQFVIHSPRMKELVKIATRIARVDSTVLIQGESGVGKELIADVIHQNSNRKKGPLIKINCGAIPENLLESEFFGYEPGAFSGASKNGKVGIFELAAGGILFLDEIGDMPLSLQVKLLRVLQDKEITRVGGVKKLTVDIRILTGTNRNLHEMIINRQFRQDLFYRLNVVPIRVPSLRERREDIPVLANYFTEYFSNKYRTSNINKHLDPDVIACFMEHDWPGNVRELENLIERLVVTTAHDKIIVDDLPFWLNRSHFNADLDMESISLRCAVEDTERKILENAFSRCKSTYEVARALNVNQSTVVRKAAKYGITRNLPIQNEILDRKNHLLLKQ